jgi:hypothetical protein
MLDFLVYFMELFYIFPGGDQAFSYSDSEMIPEIQTIGAAAGRHDWN